MSTVGSIFISLKDDDDETRRRRKHARNENQKDTRWSASSPTRQKNVQHTREIQRYHMQFGSVGPILAVVVTHEYLVPRVYRHERSSKKEKQSLIRSVVAMIRLSDSAVSSIGNVTRIAPKSYPVHLLSQNLSTWKISSEYVNSFLRYLTDSPKSRKSTEGLHTNVTIQCR